MKTIIFAATAAVALTATPLLAGGHSKSGEARAMAAALSAGVNQDQATKDAVADLGLDNGNANDNAAVPGQISGGGNGGWGNVGSTLTGAPGESISGR